MITVERAPEQKAKAAAQVATDVNARITLERDRRLASGASFNVIGIADPVPLTGRPSDQTVYLALLMQAQALKAALNDTATITLRDGANHIHELTPDQVLQLIGQGQAWFEAVMVTSWAMKDGTAPFEAGPPDDLTDDAHWPPVFPASMAQAAGRFQRATT
ncbi:hypothetical protein [Roseivivax sp. THAF197b]|uniref:DUF4376 domain-containing protein n=1 Tax=Roseivivax sp. THAF197b TaxID=2588299 RepID=UPI001268A52F|nr:hypothetical protein [Roseivivax sp. THAF197b]QFS83974.1 hypothetical protein FIV09_14150 [Roseivivax sp. THAF197b]